MKPTLSAYSEINDLLFLSYAPNILDAAIEANVFEVLLEKPMSALELSEKIKTNFAVTESLLDVLTSFNYLRKKDERFELTTLASEYLTNSSDINQLHSIKSYTVETGPFKNLLKALYGDIPKFEPRMWSSAEAIKGIEQGAKAGSIQSLAAFVNKIPAFHNAVKMCDLAGNSGYYPFALFKKNPVLKAHVYDLKEVCEIASEMKKNEANYNRISYHACDIKAGDDFGHGYDLFLSSHFLYEFGATNRLVDMLEKINKSMKMGGLFISQHMSDQKTGNLTTRAMIELMTVSMGYPSHFLPEETLKTALTKAGFGQFKTQAPDERHAYPSLLLSAIKEREV